MNYYKNVESIIEYPIEITRSGMAAMWEQGGGFLNSGAAVIIGNKNAGKKRGVCCKKYNPNGKQMLIMLNEGDKVMFGSCGANAKEAMIIIRYVYKINTEIKKAYLKSEFIGRLSNLTDVRYIKMADALYRKLNTFRCIRYLYALPVREKENAEKGFQTILSANPLRNTEKSFDRNPYGLTEDDWDNVDMTDGDWDDMNDFDLEPEIDKEAEIAETESMRGIKEDTEVKMCYGLNITSEECYGIPPAGTDIGKNVLTAKEDAI